MTEVWLRPNRRALGLGVVAPGVLMLIGVLMVWQATGGWLEIVGWLLIAAGLVLIGGIARQFFRPRIAYADAHVLFYLRTGPPIRTPIEIVEAFFLGQGPAVLWSKAESRSETMNLVARLSQRATQWHRQSVKPALGQWCDGYVTIRGTWCEPLTDDLVRSLNRQLSDAKRKVGSRRTNVADRR